MFSKVLVDVGLLLVWLTCHLSAGAGMRLQSLGGGPHRVGRLLSAAAVATADAERAKYAQPGSFIPLGNLTIGGAPQDTVCLCAAKEGQERCVDLAAVCPTLGDTNHTLPTALTNGHQGYWYEGLQPALVVGSGDTIDVETVAAGVNAFEEQVVGDPALEALFAWGPEGPAITTEGATGRGDGNHWLSGPIYVCDAEPGDVLQVDILELKPRPNPGKGNKSYGWCGTPWWGMPWSVGFKSEQPSEMIIVMEVEMSEEGYALQAVPLYSFDFGALNVTTSCAPAAAEFRCTTPEGAAAWDNSGREYGNAERITGTAGGSYTVPCKDGKQAWEHLTYVGWNFEVPESARDYTVRGAFRAATNLHLGIVGLAPAVGVTVSSAVPMRTGGNMDQKRLTAGAKLFLPVEVYGAQLSLGDGHGAMGDGEVGGTGLEMSLNAKIKVTLHKKDGLPSTLQGLDFPLLENDNEYVLQGFSFSDYLRELQDPQATVGKEATLDRAMAVAFNHTRDFLMGAFGMSEAAAVAATSLGVDFGVTQVVDGNLGVHAIVPKFLVDSSLPAPYTPAVWPGTSVAVDDPAYVAY